MNIARQGYTEKQILDALFAVGGERNIRFRYDLLDRNEEKIGELSNILRGEVSFNSLAEIKRTARFELKDDGDIDWLNNRIQPFVLLQMPDKKWVEFPQGIFLLPSPTRKDSNQNIYREIEAYDSSLILKNDKFVNRYTISAGIKYYDAVVGILQSAGISKINIEYTNKVLDRDIEFEIGTEKRQAVNDLLDIINYVQLHVDESGYFTSYQYVIPSEREVEIVYKNDSKSIIFPGVQEELDLFNVPNSWVVVASNPEKVPLVSTYINNNPNSISSVSSRNMTIVDYRQIDDIADQNILDSYVKKIAYEASQIYGYVDFETAIMPVHGYSNVLKFEYSNLKINDKYSETGWTIPLVPGGRMKHRARKVIYI